MYVLNHNIQLTNSVIIKTLPFEWFVIDISVICLHQDTQWKSLKHSFLFHSVNFSLLFFPLLWSTEGSWAPFYFQFQLKFQKLFLIELLNTLKCESNPAVTKMVWNVAPGHENFKETSICWLWAALSLLYAPASLLKSLPRPWLLILFFFCP